MTRARSWALVLAASLAACAGPPPDPSAAGRAVFAARGCALCHRVGAHGGAAGTDLSYVGLRRSRAWLRAWLRRPEALRPGTAMPDPRLSAGELEALVQYLSTLRGEPQVSIADGAAAFERLGCGACHGRGGDGRGLPPDERQPERLAPPLRGLSSRFARPALRERLLRKTPDQDGRRTMPSLSSLLAPSELDALVDYLLALKGGSV